MGLLSKLFGSDPSKDLARAERLLAKDDAAEAFRLAEKAAKAGAEGASELVERARSRAVEKGLQSAERAESSEYWGDAVEWLEGILHMVDDGQRTSLEVRITENRQKEEQANRPPVPEAEAEGEINHLLSATELPVDDLYEVFVESLLPEAVPHFEGRPEPFRRALVWLNEGEANAAYSELEPLLQDSPDDPVLLLQRARVRLLQGDAEAALPDFEAAWDALGDTPLDRAGHLSLPALWGDTQLARGGASEAASRLRELASPRSKDVEMLKVHGQALIASGRMAEAEEFLDTTWDYHPATLDFAHLLATAQRPRSAADAIKTLEQAIAPACGPGGCNRSALHLASMHSLIALQLEEGDPERARELLELLTGMRNGRLGRTELLLMAAYYDHVGEEASAQEARERAEQTA